MARGEIKNSIPDLQIEWATYHPNKSVRDFLINEKQLTERQYRYVMANACSFEWQTRREEIQNRIASTKIERLVDKAIEVNAAFIEAAKISLAKIADCLASKDLSPADLNKTMQALLSNQTVFMNALGVPKGRGLVQVYFELEVRIKAERHRPTKVQEQDPSKLDQLSADDISEFVEWRRDVKRRAKEVDLKDQAAQESIG